MTIDHALAANIVKTGYADLSDEVREMTKKSILDTLGVILPPTTLEKTCISLYELMMEAGGKKESTLLGFGGKAPCWTAAFINGACAHAIDFDDGVSGDIPIHHPTASTLPAALAMAERIGNVKGEDFITAVALGNDLSVRMAYCPQGNNMMDFPFFTITIFGVFSAAAACGKLLNFSELEMLNTFGLALHRAAGVREALFAPDSEIRAIRDGFTNQEGVISALMAGKGISACKDAIEMLFKAYFADRYITEPLLLDLGKKFRGSEAKFKIWPSCAQTHSYIQAALHIAKEYDIKPENIKEVILTGSEDGAQHCKLPEAAEPSSPIAAKFSVAFCVAVALAKRRVVISDFLPQNLKNIEVIEIARKIKFNVNPAFGVFSPVTIEVTTRKGESFSFKQDSSNNSSANLSVEELIAKFKDCAGHSRKRLSKAKVDKLVSLVLQLEKVNDINEITDILA
jgi:2-methylcitrate dehydratase PrpD